MKFTILGGAGFIGGHLARHLRAQGIETDVPARDAVDLRGRKLGHVIYAIGLTGNFRTRLRETVEAHIGVLQKLMDGVDFESWLYLSSTRVYAGAERTSEDAELCVKPGPDSLYDLSKLLGEAICLSVGSPAVRVARLSNVYGAGQGVDNFLGAVLKDCAATGRVTLGEAPESSKDYIAIEDVVEKLQAIALRGRERLYNVASGRGTTHVELAAGLKARGYAADFAPGGPKRAFPAIDVARMTREFGAAKHELIRDLQKLLPEPETRKLKK